MNTLKIGASALANVRVVLFVLLFVVISCKHNPAGPAAENQSSNNDLHSLNSTLKKEVISAGNSFGFKFFNRISSIQKDSNVILSPFSVSMAFGMLLNGANGPTLDSLEQALGDAGMSLDDINNTYKNASTFLTTLDPNTTFQNANSIWYRFGFSVLPAFVNTNRIYFDAEVDSLDFNSSGAVQTINNWVNTKTNGKIRTVLEGAIPSDVLMYIINAIYFKGSWTNKFDSLATTNAPFTCTDGSKVSCKMMRQENTFAYYEDKIVQAVDLPYGNQSFSMTIVLPAAGTSINQFVSALTQDQWNAIISKLNSTDIILNMPQFKLEYSKSLNDDLKVLGMGIVFDKGRADLSNINPARKLFVSDVFHKTYLSVSEQGTEAAAVTVVDIRNTSANPEKINVKINRPFVFVIRENNSGTIVFIGKIVEPVS